MTKDGEEKETGSVRSCLIDPLVEMGMVKKKAVKVEDHKRMLGRLVSKLSYMSADNLRGLQAYLIKAAGGASHSEWPSEVAILQAAHGLQEPPVAGNDYALSLIRSAMGQRARAEGWMVELYRVARRTGPPPGKYLVYKMKEEAGQNERRGMLVSERIYRGVASQEDRDWLARYQSDLDACEAVFTALGVAE